MAQCEATAQPDYDPEAPDPDNVWGALKSSIVRNCLLVSRIYTDFAEWQGQDALAKGDPAFLDGEMVDAYRAYNDAVGMEPLNKPAQLRLKAAECALGFPSAEKRSFNLPVSSWLCIVDSGAWC